MNDQDQSSPGPNLPAVEIFAMGLVICALVDGCQAFLKRVATVDTLGDEIAKFRDQAIGNIKGSVGVGIAINDEADAMRRALENINKLCDDWLGQGSRPAK